MPTMPMLILSLAPRMRPTENAALAAMKVLRDVLGTVLSSAIRIAGRGLDWLGSANIVRIDGAAGSPRSRRAPAQQSRVDEKRNSGYEDRDWPEGFRVGQTECANPTLHCEQSNEDE